MYNGAFLKSLSIGLGSIEMYHVIGELCYKGTFYKGFLEKWTFYTINSSNNLYRILLIICNVFNLVIKF